MLSGQGRAQPGRDCRFLRLGYYHQPFVGTRPDDAQVTLSDGGAGGQRRLRAQCMLHRCQEGGITRVAAQVQQANRGLAGQQRLARCDNDGRRHLVGLAVGLWCKGLRHAGAPIAGRRKRGCRWWR